MIGALLVTVATFAEEIGSTVSKYSLAHKIERPFTMGLASHLAGVAMLVAIGLFIPQHFFGPNFPGGFVFALASLPTLIPRIILEIAQAHVGLLALARAERSTFAFLRVLTIPLLLFVDIVLGYPMSTYQIVGIALIIAGLLFLSSNHGIHRRGAGLVLFTALNAVATISLFKYNVTHFNSVEAEQSIVLVCIVLYFFVMAHIQKERPLKHLTHKAEVTQLVTGSIATAAFSFAYLYMPPSVATAGKRALSGLWALSAGAFYFREKHLAVKIVTLLLVMSGIALLAIPQ